MAKTAKKLLVHVKALGKKERLKRLEFSLIKKHLKIHRKTQELLQKQTLPNWIKSVQKSVGKKPAWKMTCEMLPQKMQLCIERLDKVYITTQCP